MRKFLEPAGVLSICYVLNMIISVNENAYYACETWKYKLVSELRLAKYVTVCSSARITYEKLEIFDATGRYNMYFQKSFL